MTSDSSDYTAPEITCREVAEWTSAYLEEHVDDPSKVRMALHLAACAGCEAYVAQIASVRDLLGLLPGTPVEPAHLDRLRQAFAARRPRPPSTT
jgi:anti-sigma factor RsiW